MIAAFTCILVCQLAGEALARGLGLPVPGPVIGMVFMLLLLFARDRFRARLPAAFASEALPDAGKGLLAHLSLLFVPAGVGVVQRLDLLGAHGVALLVTLVVSTAAAMLATVGTFVVMARLLGARNGGDGGDGEAAQGGAP